MGKNIIPIDDEVSELETFEENRTKTAAQYYTPELADKILGWYIEGNTMAAIARKSEMPAYSTLINWARTHDEFRRKLQAAREVRALHFEDAALEAGTERPSKDDVPGARLAFDAYKWAAEVNDPSRYGKKTTISGDSEKPLTFIIHTGFPELTPEQRSPKLGVDGLAEKALEISREVVLSEQEE